MKHEEYKKMKRYEEGALKRKLGIKKGDKLSAGDMIRKANELKRKKLVATLGLV